MISQQININKNKRGKQSAQTAVCYSSPWRPAREPWCVPLTDVTSLYSLDMQMCWSNAHCYSLPLRQMRLILFVYLLSAFSPGKKRRHRSLDASTGLKTNADFSRVASKQLWNREVELWLLSSLISSPVEGSIGPWTWLRADWLPRWWVGGCQCEGRSCFGGACVGICSMSTCEVQKMNPISQESPTYVKYIVPLYQFIYQATECQLDSQDGAGIWRVVGANALPQLSSSGWLHLEHRRCLPLHGGAYRGVVTFPKGREASRRRRPTPKPESCHFGSAPLMKMSGRGARAVCQMSPQPGDQMRWEDRMMKQPAAHLQLGTSQLRQADNEGRGGSWIGEVREWKETGRRRNGYCDISVNMCFLFRITTGLHLINSRCIVVRSLKPHQELTDTVFFFLWYSSLLDTIITKSLIISIKWTIFFLILHIVNKELI